MNTTACLASNERFPTIRQSQQGWSWRSIGVLGLLASLLAAGWFGSGDAHRATTTEHPATRPIETIRVGDRVLVDAPQAALDADPSYGGKLDLEPIDPEKYRLVRMRAEDRWPDGTLDVIHVESLQPCEWIESQKIHVDSVVTPPLDLVELVLPAELKAEIIEILPCPVIHDGPGRAVVTTVNHLNPRVVELSLKDARGTLRDASSH